MSSPPRGSLGRCGGRPLVVPEWARVRSGWVSLWEACANGLSASRRSGVRGSVASPGAGSASSRDSDETGVAGPGVVSPLSPVPLASSLGCSSDGAGSGRAGPVAGASRSGRRSLDSSVPDRGCPLPPLSSTVSPRSKRLPRLPGGWVSGRWYAAVAARFAPAPLCFPVRRSRNGRGWVTVSGGP